MSTTATLRATSISKRSHVSRQRQRADPLTAEAEIPTLCSDLTRPVLQQAGQARGPLNLGQDRDAAIDGAHHDPVAARRRRGGVGSRTPSAAPGAGVRYASGSRRADEIKAWRHGPWAQPASANGHQGAHEAKASRRENA